MIKVPGIAISAVEYTSPEQRVNHHCVRSLSLLNVILVRTPTLPERTWDPKNRVLYVCKDAPLYILVHEVAHVWVAEATGCIVYPEFGLGRSISFTAPWAPDPFMIEDSEARDTQEDAARVLGMLLLTRWSGDGRLAYRAQFAEQRSMLRRRGARECLHRGLIYVSSYDGKLKLAPEGDSTPMNLYRYGARDR